jgi:hypothetical protein
MNNRAKIYARKQEIKSLAKDLSKFQRLVYLSREKMSPIFSPAYISNILIRDRNWYKTAAIFLVWRKPGFSSAVIQSNMARVKAMGGLVCSITDSGSYGWANVFTDYTFLMPSGSTPKDYYFVLKLLRHYMRQI